jgi:hypothetical protein
VIRISSLDDLFECAPSVLNHEALLASKQENAAATVGTAVHALLSDLVCDGKYDLFNTLAQHGLSKYDEDVAELASYGVKAWREIGHFFPSAQVEVACSVKPHGGGPSLEGTIDVVAPISEKAAIFADWKTGYLDAGYHNQMWGYALAIWDTMGRASDFTCTGIVVFLRHRYYRIVKYTAGEIEEWERSLVRNVLGNSKLYKVGRACRYCKLHDACPARQQKVTAFIDLLIRGGDPLTTADPEFARYVLDCKQMILKATRENKTDPRLAAAVNDLSYMTKLAEQQIEAMRATTRTMVERVGPVPLTENTALALRKIDMKKLDPQRALPVLRKKLDDVAICDAMRISLPQVLAKVSALALKGERPIIQDELMSELEEAEAVTVTTHLRLEEVQMDLEQINGQQGASKPTRHDNEDSGGRDSAGAVGPAGTDDLRGGAAEQATGGTGDGSGLPPASERGCVPPDVTGIEAPRVPERPKRGRPRKGGPDKAGTGNG